MTKQEQEIDPTNVTKPIQLLATWLSALVLINGAFLTCAVTITSPWWASGALIIAAIMNVPIFVVLLFLLQTRYRVEQLDDEHYSKQLETNKQKLTVEDVSIEVATLRQDVFESVRNTLTLMEDIRSSLHTVVSSEYNSQTISKSTSEVEHRLEETKVQIEVAQSKTEWEKYRIALNTFLPRSNDIRATLKQEGVSEIEEFGKKPVDIGILACGSNVPISIIRSIYRAIKGYGIEYIKFTSDDAQHDGRVYIGSLNLGADSIAKIDDELDQAILAHHTTLSSLKSLVISKLGVD